jgi:glycosyltransferase involved in cell wall biosynthesis
MYKERVLFVTEDLSLPVDEGMKKFNHLMVNFIQSNFSESRVYAGSSGGNTINARQIKGKTFLSISLLGEIRKFNPQLIVYSPLSSGTLASFLRLFILRLAARRCRTVIVNLQRMKHITIAKMIIHLIRPTRVVVFSRREFDYFVLLRLNPVFCRAGVDINRFSPVNVERKRELKAKYGFSNRDILILHVGHLNRGRNIEVLKFLAKEGRKVLVVGSTSTAADISLKNDLTGSGILIFDYYIANIEEIYQLSDVYVFPVINDHSAIEFPLSVLEAMSCNLPVVSTPYGALPDFFAETECLAYFSDAKEMTDKTDKVLSAGCINRSVAERFSWDTVLNELIDNIAVHDTVSDGY